jgi:C4-dicarboxylate transporter DctM subunit
VTSIASAPAPSKSPAGWAERLEQIPLVLALGLAVVLPLVDAIGRPLGGFHIPGSASYVQMLTLWLAFVGGLVATREGKHLTLSTAELFGDGRAAKIARIFAYSVAAATVGILAYASAQVVIADSQGAKILPIGIPEWWLETIMPAALALMAARFAWHASGEWRGRAVAFAAIAAAFALGLLPPEAVARVWPLVFVIVAGALLGAPVFVAMGGIALVLFFRDGTPVAAVSA